MNNIHQEKEHILFIGFGDIAQRLSRLVKNQCSMTGFKRKAIDDYPNVNIVLGDYNEIEDVKSLFSKHYDIIVITLTPTVIDEAGYQKAYFETSRTLLTVLDQQKKVPRLILFVSSTSIYGQKNGEWVDETSATEPTSFSGKILLATESLWQDSIYNTCILRFSGIYGPGRKRLIEQVQQGRGTAAEPPLYSNRIHADDGAAALFHLIEKSKSDAIESLYIATDSDPVPLNEVKQWLAKTMNLPDHHLQNQTTGRGFRGSKRCSNRLLLDSGFRFRYSGFREGYAAILKQDD